MDRLRDILKNEDPTLYQSLMACWEIAEKEWIPTLNMESESHSGLPHLLNVEGWMDKVADACRFIWSPHSSLPFGFSSLEIYVTLCSALFHDIGRGRPSTKKHGEVSKEIIDRDWAQLGLLNGRVAYELGHICEFHTGKGPWTHHDTVKIHPWGTMHTQAISSLLCLADELDTAYTRVAPDYMKDPEFVFQDQDEISLSKLEKMSGDYFTKGLMRDFISSLDLDPSSHLIKTVLFSDKLPGKHTHESGTVSAGWLDALTKRKEIPDRFSVEDYFFNYLDYLRMHTDNSILEFLAKEYASTDRHNRTQAIGVFSPPTDSKVRQGFGYLLPLWDRKISGIETGLAREIRLDVDALRKTVTLIEEMIDGVQEMVERAQQPGLSKCVRHVGAKTDDYVGLLQRIGGSVYYRAKRGKLVSEEQQIGPDRFAKGMATLPSRDPEQCWKAAETQLRRSESDVDPEERPYLGLYEDISQLLAIADASSGSCPAVAVTDAHARLVKLFRYLLYVDLSKCPSKAKEPTVFRQWESWDVRSFHNNLLIAFRIYLVNARRLWQSSDAISYRVDNADGYLHSLIAQTEGRCDPGTNDHKARKTQEDAHRKDLDQARKRLIDDLNTYAEKHAAMGHTSTIKGSEFLQAVRLMFMQWVMNDVRGKNKVLKRIRPGLEKLEIPFKEWSVEYDNHLFDEEWRLRLEPSLTRKSIVDMAEKVFELQAELIREDDHLPWHMLSAALKDHRMERVRTGAERLSSLLRIYSLMPEEFRDVDDPKKKLHFGHFILADLKRPDGGEDKKRAALETSHSTWILQREGTEIKDLNRFLERVYEPGDKKQ